MDLPVSSTFVHAITASPQGIRKHTNTVTPKSIQSFAWDKRLIRLFAKPSILSSYPTSRITCSWRQIDVYLAMCWLLSLDCICSCVIGWSIGFYYVLSFVSVMCHVVVESLCLSECVYEVWRFMCNVFAVVCFTVHLCVHYAAYRLVLFYSSPICTFFRLFVFLALIVYILCCFECCGSSPVRVVFLWRRNGVICFGPSIPQIVRLTSTVQQLFWSPHE